ncbi:MAG: sigma-70 family RNA polymerase sigma factor [Salinivirgaceae bacterium]|jgi:RNA polymerase sigma-70 factor (ECF subfamily)|nr:sigma-70 family RNA polymerase sigma factor [Salinivirgaceae bacterium]
MKLIKNLQPQNLHSKTDSELVFDYKQSLNTEIIGEIYERYHHIVFGVALKYLKDTELAQDALLDVFNNLFEQLAKYKIDEFKSWLLTVTRNHSLRLLKENAKSAPLEYANNKDLTINFMENEHKIDLLNEKEKQIIQMEEALTKLKPEQKLCVSLFYLDDKTYQEIADETGFSIKKVKSYIQNGKRNMQILMTKVD